MEEQIMNYIVQYGPGVAAVLAVIVAEVIGNVRSSGLFKTFKKTAMTESDEKIKEIAENNRLLREQNETLKKQNGELREMIGEMKAENIELKKSHKALIARVSHVEFREK